MEPLVSREHLQKFIYLLMSTQFTSPAAWYCHRWDVAWYGILSYPLLSTLTNW